MSHVELSKSIHLVADVHSPPIKRVIEIAGASPGPCDAIHVDLRPMRISLTAPKGLCILAPMRLMALFIFAFCFVLTLNSVGNECSLGSCHSEAMLTATTETQPHHALVASAIVEQSSEDLTSSDSGDCHCPLHRRGCGHSIGAILKLAPSLHQMSVPALAHFGPEPSLLQEPLLEGPFQPPRA